MGYSMTNANFASFSFAVDNAVATNNFIFDFNNDNFLRYKKQPFAIGSFTIYAQEIDQRILFRIFSGRDQQSLRFMTSISLGLRRLSHPD
jgi:hypothetical protein